MTRLPTLLAISSFAITALVTAKAKANGAYTHAHISQLAHAMLPPGELRTLLEDPALAHAYECGSLFPDSGYAIDDPYGELAHWEAFLDAYIQDLRARYGGDYESDEARRELAFVLGVASHGMADQSYDTTLLARAFEVDGPEPEGVSVDQYADYFLADHDVSFSVDAWAPYAHLPAVIASASGGHAVSEDTLMTAMSRMSIVTRVQSEPSRSLYFTAWESFPFLGTHLYNDQALGSLPWLASMIAEYWQVVWRRLHGTDDPDADLVIRTVPADGGENFPVDRSESEAWGRIAIFFGYAILRDATAPLITLRDEARAAIPFTLESAYNGQDRNLIFVVPSETLAYDEVHTVELAAGVTTISGRVTTAPFLFSFRTRCAPDALDDCPPLDPPLVTGPIPMRPARRDAGPPPDAGSDAGPPVSAGGCAVSAPGGGTAWWLAALGLVALKTARSRRARRRGAPARRPGSAGPADRAPGGDPG